MSFSKWHKFRTSLSAHLYNKSAIETTLQILTEYLADYLQQKYIECTTGVYTLAPNGTPTKVNFNVASTVTDGEYYELISGNLKILEAGCLLQNKSADLCKGKMQSTALYFISV